MELRLQKYLSECGVASRRKSEQIILGGRISVNGKIVTTLGFKIDDSNDTVLFDGNPVKKNENYVYIMLNKPKNYVTTAKDQFGRPTVLDLVDSGGIRVFPVGRLDYNTSGLLLMTNDGALAFKLTHPKYNIEKSYIARINGVLPPAKIREFENGLFIDGKKTAPAKLSALSTENNISTLKITISEGRNRQIRKMLELMGYNTLALKRISIGSLKLDGLNYGEYRHLTANEIEYLKYL